MRVWSGRHGHVVLPPGEDRGEDVVEEPVDGPAIDAIPGYDEETRLPYVGGLTENTGQETLAE